MKSVNESALKGSELPGHSMQPKGRKRALTATISTSVLMAAGLMLAAGSAQAIDISQGEVSGSFDTTISYGIRLSSQ